MAAGILPDCPAPRTFRAKADGNVCDGCGGPIARDVAYELDLADQTSSGGMRTLNLHLMCHAIWWREVTQMKPGGSQAG